MPVALRGDFDATMVRAATRRSKDGAQARRLLALAAIYDGATRTEAAKIGGVTLQIARDWVVKFNAHGPEALRLRVRAQRHRQPVQDVRAARRLAPCQSHRSPYRRGLCSRLEDLADVHFTNARTIVLVQDNLNIHSRASLYEAFPAADARRLVERFEWRYTPKHGSWLDLAESELGILSSQSLDRRIPDATLIRYAIGRIRWT